MGVGWVGGLDGLNWLRWIGLGVELGGVGVAGWLVGWEDILRRNATRYD